MQKNLTTEKPSSVLIKITDLSYRPADADHNVLQDISLEIDRGEFVLLLGPPGSGKTMLTQCFNGLIPHIFEGDMRGTVHVVGKDTFSHTVDELAATVGMVFQNPDDQIVSLKVRNEVAWGVENQGLCHEEILQRVGQVSELMGITELLDKLTFAISGGQKQKVSIASNLAMMQEILVLDDPTTDLDPICKAEVVDVLSHLHREMGKTLIVIEHDLNDLIEHATRLIVMNEGRIVFDGEPGALFSEHYEALEKLGINIPQHVEIANAVSRHVNSKHIGRSTRKEASLIQLRSFLESRPAVTFTPHEDRLLQSEPVILMRGVDFSYLAGIPVLRGIDLEIYRGELVAVIGANGSGKSTLVKTLIGLLKPNKGEVIICGKDLREIEASDLMQDLGYVFQNPDNQLFTNSVTEEVGFGLKIRGALPEEVHQRVSEVLEIVGLSAFRHEHPFSLSRGQRQKLAVATALIHQPGIILLDEPTTGQDRSSLEAVIGLMVRLNQEGNTTLMITHDMDIVAAHATRVLVMAEGQIMIDGPPEQVFYDHFDTLSELNLRPPTLIDFCRSLEDLFVPRCLTTRALSDYIGEVASKN